MVSSALQQRSVSSALQQLIAGPVKCVKANTEVMGGALISDMGLQLISDL